MDARQREAAQKAMVEWLAHPQELGKAPAKIECAGSFALHEMQYYMFKYKTWALGKWLLGVCGGYERDSLEHCGHVFSEMKAYDPATAQTDATAMVETIRTYWMERAEQGETSGEQGGSFLGFVLLSEVRWDKGQFLRGLKEDWGLEAAVDEDEEGDALVFPVGDMTAAVSLMPAPVPEGEAEANAANNYLWPQAVEAAKAHRGHILVAVLGDGPAVEKGKLLVKLLSGCCKQKNAMGVYTSGTVFQPEFYHTFAQVMKEDALPIYNWIWFGLYRREGGVCCYTYGMKNFGKDEMEVLDADGQPSDVREFLFSMAAYVLEYDVTLKDGETIGFNADDKHAITRGEGVSLPGMTLKIGYSS